MTRPQPTQAAVVQRLHRYAGCQGYVLRWFIATDAAPMAYRTQEEARAELHRRQAEQREGGQS